MLDPKIEAIAREKIRLEFDEREGQLGRDIGAVVSDFANRNVLRSSMAIQAVAEVFERELKIRQGLAYSALQRVCAEFGVQAGADLAPSMKAFLDDVIGTQADRLRAQMLETQPVKSTAAVGIAAASFNVDVLTPYERVRANVLSNAHTEVDLFEARLSTAARQAQVTGNRVSVTGANNFLFTGNFSSSPVTITMNAGAKAELERALAVVEEGLAKLAEPVNFNVDDVRGMIADSKAELTKPNPNLTKLGSILMGAAATIQTAGSLTAAYAVLKGALAMVGITLP